MPNPYDESENFNHRLKVETTFAPGDVRDHREGFSQREYRRNMQDKPQANEGGGFPAMKSVTEAPKPKGGTKPVRQRKKTKQDEAVEAANTKDLKNRNLN